MSCSSSESAEGRALPCLEGVRERPEKAGRKPLEGRERMVAVGELMAVWEKEA